MDSILPPITININGGDKQNKTVASPSANNQRANPDESSQGISGAERAVRRLVSFGTAKHIAALKEVGPCPIHRQSFIKGILAK